MIGVICGTRGAIKGKRVPKSDTFSEAFKRIVLKSLTNFFISFGTVCAITMVKGDKNGSNFRAN